MQLANIYVIHGWLLIAKSLQALSLTLAAAIISLEDWKMKNEWRISVSLKKNIAYFAYSQLNSQIQKRYIKYCETVTSKVFSINIRLGKNND